MAEEARPDPVLMDINLSGEMDGIEAAGEIQGRLNIPVVYLTGFTNGATLQRAKETAPYGYIVKPFDEDEVHAAIEVAVHKHRMEMERVAVERREAREREDKFRELLDLSNDAVFVIDPATDEILDVNGRAADMLGYSREEVMSMSVSSIHAETDGWGQFVQTIFETGSGRTDQVDLVTKDRERLLTDTVASMIAVDGRACILAIVSDITQARHSDKMLEQSQQELEQRVRELKALHALVQQHLTECDHPSEDGVLSPTESSVGTAATD